MVKIKHLLQDFIVKEKTNINLEEGPHKIYLLKKTNYTTERAVMQLTRSLHLPRKFISYAGTKDKNGITYQYISIKNCSKEKIDNLKLKDIELEYVGTTKTEMKLGDLEGNEFEIVLRDLPQDITLKETNELLIPNYFDEQRFSTANLQIGLFLIQKNFKEAINLLSQTDGDFKEKIEEHLQKHPNDFIGALKILPKKTTLFFIHSVQSYFFNELLSQKINQFTKQTYELNYSEGKMLFADIYPPINSLPLIGYMTEGYEDLLQTKNIVARDFLIKSLPEFSLEGGERDAFFQVKNLELFPPEDDEEFTGKKKQKLKFELGSGSYATIVIKSILAKNKLSLEN